MILWTWTNNEGSGLQSCKTIQPVYSSATWKLVVRNGRYSSLAPSYMIVCRTTGNEKINELKKKTQLCNNWIVVVWLRMKSKSTPCLHYHLKQSDITITTINPFTWSTWLTEASWETCVRSLSYITFHAVEHHFYFFNSPEVRQQCCRRSGLSLKTPDVKL